jgi:murein DD-endopeptidase MepM/ murein hydrolase activator NlpD
MATRVPSQDENYYLPIFEELANGEWQTPGRKIDPLVLVLLGLLAFLTVQLVLDARRGGTVSKLVTGNSITSESEGTEDIVVSSSVGQSNPQVAPADLNLVIFPYDNYWITQGPHGMSYGHLAIDIAAGKGSPIKSPIYGTVTANYIDQYGNTTLVLENERYQLTMLHGDYSVAVGQEVQAGQLVGSESNHGYTTDMQGRLCTNRDCGHHTHLNLFDKTINQNVNPLDILIDQRSGS